VSKALYRINASGYYIEANKFDKVYNRELKALRKKNYIYHFLRMRLTLRKLRNIFIVRNT
jgi:hypothetical protein